MQVTIKCRKCDTKLDYNTTYWPYMDGPEVRVEPCQACSAHAEVAELKAEVAELEAEIKELHNG